MRISVEKGTVKFWFLTPKVKRKPLCDLLGPRCSFRSFWCRVQQTCSSPLQFNMLFSLWSCVRAFNNNVFSNIYMTKSPKPQTPPRGQVIWITVTAVAVQTWCVLAALITSGPLWRALWVSARDLISIFCSVCKQTRVLLTFATFAMYFCFHPAGAALHPLCGLCWKTKEGHFLCLDSLSLSLGLLQAYLIHS